MTTHISWQDHNVSHMIGQRIKLFRKLHSMTQIDLAKRLGISSQQLHKYESGTNRITADRFFQIFILLNIDLEPLYRDIVNEINGKPSDAPKRTFTGLNAEKIELLLLFESIKNTSFKNLILTLIKDHTITPKKGVPHAFN